MKEHIIINKDRTVVVPDSVRKIGIQYDHKVNTLTFDCPRYADDNQSIDLSRMAIYINFSRNDKTKGSIAATNVFVDPDDPEIMHFDFIITRSVTLVNGSIICLVCAKSTDAEGVEVNHWNSELFNKLSVGEGMEAEEELTEEEIDYITSLLQEINTTHAEVADIDTRVEDLEFNQEKQGVVSEVDLDAMTWTDGSYITGSGTIGSSSGYGISELVTIPKMSTLILDATGYQSDVAMIAKSDHTPLVTSVDGKTHYEYYTDEEIQVYISCKTTVVKSAKIVRNVSDTLSDLERENSELKSDLVELSLPYTPVGELKTHTYMDVQGVINSNYSYECFVIPIEEIYNNKCIVTTNATSTARIAVYFSGEPSSSTLITSESAEYPDDYGTLKVYDYELNIPNDTKYIVVNNKTNEGVMIVKTISTKAIVDSLNNKSDKSELGSKVNSLSYYKDKATRTYGKLIKANGSIVDFDDGILATYDLNGDTKIKISGYGWSTNYGYCLCLFKDKNGSVVSTILKDSEVVNDFEVDVPTNAIKVFVNGNINSSTPIINAEAFETDFKKCYEIVSSINYEGKNFLCLGDSITALYGWRKFFEAKTNPNRVDCVAVIGAHWCDYNSSTVYNGNPQAVGDEQNVIGNQVQKIINNRSNYLDDYDYIFICAGTNDDTIPSDGITNAMINEAYFENGDIRPLENIDRSKLAGATRWVVQKLRELFPTAKIVFTTPINRIDVHMCDRVFDNRKAILTCANAVSVDICDTTKCGINMYDSTDFSDNLHPNDKGAKKLGEYIANWYISHYVD